MSCARYLLGSEDAQVKGAMSLHMELMHMAKYSIIGEAQDVLRKYSILHTLSQPLPEEVPTHKGLVKTIRKAQEERLRAQLRSKKVHGVYAKETDKPGCDRAATFVWLRDGRLQAVTEGLVVAAQDGVTYTQAYRRRYRKEKISETCRRCGKRPETIGHLLSSCESSLWSLIFKRHNRVLYQLVKAVAATLKIRLPKALKAPGGVAKPGVFRNSTAKITIDQSKHECWNMKRRRKQSTKS